MHSGVPRCIESECERKLFWIAVVSNRQAQCVAILHDIDETTELDHEARRHDLAPAGIRVQRRPHFGKRRAHQIRFLEISATLSQPARNPCADPPEIGRHPASGVEPRHAVLNRGEQREQRQHVPAQALQAAHDGCRSGSLIVEMITELVDCGRCSGKAHAFVVAVRIAAAAGQDICAEPARICKPGVRLTRDGGGDAPRQHEHRDDARTDDSQRDFLHTGDRDVERQFGCRENRKPDNCDGIACQHEDIAARRAVE